MASSINTISPKTKEIVDLYQANVSSGFTPIPIAIERSENAKLYDVDGKEYIDLLGMFAVVNMGHNHPKIVKAAQDALAKCSMINTLVMSPSYARLAKKLTDFLGYDKFVGLTSGAEATDAAIKIARKWSFVVKKIPAGESLILSTDECYHGLTTFTHAFSNPRRLDFGPFPKKVGPVLPDGTSIRFGVAQDLEDALAKYGDQVGAFIVEPVQGSAGIIVPPLGYMKEVYDICKKYNVLLIADEVQTGFGRTGYDLASFKDNIKPDLVCLGKALAGGLFPLSGVVGFNEVMDHVALGEVGSTMAATPPATEAAIAALDVLVDEKLTQRSLELGEKLQNYFREKNPPHLLEVAGQGLFVALVLDPKTIVGRRFSGILAKRGVVAKTTGGNRMRISPALTIPENELFEAADIIIQALKDYESIEGPIPFEDDTYFH